VQIFERIKIKLTDSPRFQQPRIMTFFRSDAQSIPPAGNYTLSSHLFILFLFRLSSFFPPCKHRITRDFAPLRGRKPGGSNSPPL
jgi:hypothetical protein